MTAGLELYCIADRLFYESPDRRATADGAFAITARPAPDGWERHPTDTWIHLAPRDARVPPQGWKIHVSSQVHGAEEVIARIWDYCLSRRLAFKFLRSEPVIVMLNSKSAARGSSGKLVTIYPEDEDRLQAVLAELEPLLADVEGPYILSDLRYGTGPLFVRYGGFVERHCTTEGGERVLALEDGDGRLVPDVRGPVFSVPPWVRLPAFLEPHLAARNAVTTAGLPYAIESVLQFSNGGGVYLGRDLRSGERVVLKEGRPHAGLDVAGRDAVARLEHERDILDRLAGLPVVPALRDFFVLGDHRFLVEEFVDGNPLQRLIVHRYPLTHPDATEDARADYARWALDVLVDLERAVGALHERGVVFGDLHPDNVLVGEDGRLVLIDFEVATLVADRVRSALAHPGYQPPPDRTGTEVDRYALACMHLGLFAPQTTILIALERAKAGHLAGLVAEAFPVPPALLRRAVATIAGEDGGDDDAMEQCPMPGRASWPRLRRALRTAILASATPDRHDRLFPGDPAGLGAGHGIGLAHGAAGVLLALAVTGGDPLPEHVDWLVEHTLDRRIAAGAGVHDGLHGVAYALHGLGRTGAALDAIDLALREDHDSLGLGLAAGLAGVGLTLLHLGAATGEPALTVEAERVVERVADRLGGPDDVPEISGGDHPRAGLGHGSSGAALLFCRAHEARPDPALLDLAAVALRQDLRRCTLAEDGSLQVDQGWRSLPYLDEGSVGIALALARYLALRRDEDLAWALAPLRAVLSCDYVVQPGLFTGRAGLVAALGMTARLEPDAGWDAARDRAVAGLAWHALPFRGGLAFPGDGLMRLSMDLATGTAGVLLALGCAMHDAPVHLPLLEPTSGAPAPTRPAEGGTPVELSIPTTPERR